MHSSLSLKGFAAAAVAVLVASCDAASPPQQQYDQLQQPQQPQQPQEQQQQQQSFQQVKSPSSVQCDTVCKHIYDSSTVGSLGGSIESSIITNGNLNIIQGTPIPGWSGAYSPSAIWSLWVKAYEIAFPSGISHLGDFSSNNGRVCVDIALLAKLTAAASQCHSQAVNCGGSNGPAQGQQHGESGGSWTWTNNPGLSGGSMQAGGTSPPSSGGHTVVVGTGGGGGVTTGGGSVGGGSVGGGSVGGGSVGGGNTDTTSSVGGGTNTHITTGGGNTVTSSWGTGGVNSDICFKIKDKRSDRYLTTYGTEYAFAYYPTYWSVFRAHASKSVEGAFTLTETKRNLAAVNYPVKLGESGQFKPLYGDKDALFTFSPARFGDSCWGVPNKKMARRHDWGGWGDNYRQSSSGSEDCADVELEEADC